jgi:hypothetical protein
MAVEERRGAWNFDVDAGDWIWDFTPPNGMKIVSPRRFSTLHECMADAKNHGYVVWLPENERRGE